MKNVYNYVCSQFGECGSMRAHDSRLLHLLGAACLEDAKQLGASQEAMRLFRLSQETKAELQRREFIAHRFN